MTSTYTSNKHYDLQATGDNPNTWGSVLNTNVFTIIDSNFGGRLSISCAGNTDVTLSQTQADNVYHTMTGVLTGNIGYVVPNAGSFFFLKNSTTGNFSVTAKPLGGTGVVIPQNATVPVFANPDTGAMTALFDTLPGLRVYDSTVPKDGIYLPAANNPAISANSAKALGVLGVSSGVNYIDVSNAASGNFPSIGASATSAGTNIGTIVHSKGNESIIFKTEGAAGPSQVVISDTASATRTLNLTGSNGGAPSISTSGGDLALQSSTGLIQFASAGSFTANGAVATVLGSVGATGSHTTVQEWFTFKNASGTTRFVPAF